MSSETDDHRSLAMATDGSVDNRNLKNSPRSNRYDALNLDETETKDSVIYGDTLEPAPGTEAAVDLENKPFAFTPGQLGKMFNPNSLGAFRELGGLQGLEKGLRADEHAGLSLDDAKLDDFVTCDDALKPDPGNEADFLVEDNPFAFSPGQLSKMFNPKSLDAFYALGGLQGLERGLRSDRRTGLSLDEEKIDGFISFNEATAGHSPRKYHRTDEKLKKSTTEHHRSMPWQDRLRIYGDNRPPARHPRSFLQLLWITYNDKILLLLTIASVISLAPGLYQMCSPDSFGSSKSDGFPSACTAIAIMLSLAFANSLQEHRKGRRADSQRRRREGDRLCRVKRSGVLREVRACELMVGDVLFIDPGDIIPVDGVLIDGHAIKCDESSMTGESDIIRKQSSDEVFDAIINNRSMRRMDPLLVSGSRVLEGVGHMMCTATGAHSSWGKVLASLEEPLSSPDPVPSIETCSRVHDKPEIAHAAAFVISVLFTVIFQLTGSAPLQALADFWDLLRVEDITRNPLLIKFCLANVMTSVAIIPWALLRSAELKRRLNIWEAWTAMRLNVDAGGKPLPTASDQAFALKDMQSDRDYRASFLAERAAINSLREPNINFLKKNFYREGRLTEEQALWILKKGNEVLRAESNISEMDAPITVGGDVHGQYYDVMESFNQAVALANQPSAVINRRVVDSMTRHISWLGSSLEYQAWLMGRTRPRRPTYLRSAKAANFSTRKTENFIEGLVNGRRIQAFPDNGADRCSISPELAARLGLEMTPGTERTLRLPNGSHIQSPGMVELSWKFVEEPEEQKLKCWVVPGCVHDLILGSPFLRASQTLTKFAHRIKSKLVNPYGRLHVRLLGDTQQRLRGSLDGHETMAMADSGSDVMLISKAYAQKCGLHIDRDPANFINLEFVDGSTEWTNGIVRNVPWSVEGSIRYCDFFVLDSLCEDLILSNAYLTETNSFVNHTDSFFDLSQPRDVSQLCLIRLIGRFSSNLNLLELDYLKDLTSPDAFNDEKIQRELARRDQIRDEISALPVSQREAASRAETERQLAWENHREAHRQGWRAQLAGPLLYSSSSDSGGSSGAPLAGQGFVVANHLEAGCPTSPTNGKKSKSGLGRMAVFKKLLRAKP